jgi:hypothetical protein
VPFGKYINRTDRRYCPRTDYFKLDAAFNTGYGVEYLFFARILALCRAQVITIPTIPLGSLHSITPMRIVGIVIARARHSAKIRANSLIVSRKKLFQSSRTYAVKWHFLAENQSDSFKD